jgi:hypothetical protein
MIVSARRSRSWRSGSTTEVWCRTCNCFIGLLHLLILLEEPENGETGLSPHLPLQLLHLPPDYQVNRFMGCDCHIEETFRVLKQELGWSRCSCQKQQAQGAHLHLGLYALALTQQTAFAHGQTIYAFRPSLFVQSIPQNPLALQEFAQAA